MRPTWKRLFIDVAAVWLSTLLVAGPAPARLQDPDFVVRDMQDSQLFRNRPKTRRAGARTGRAYRQTSAPKPAPPAVSESKAPVGAAPADAEIGFTMWRLRPAVAGDPEGVRDIVHEPNGAAVSLTPERVTGELALSLGDRFRFAVESSRHGFLYVVNRPVYDDGAPRDPVLIFPTRRLRGGGNEMTGGVLVELPSPFDSPPFFRIVSNPGRLVGEEVILLVTPKPLELEIGDKPIRLTNETIAEWERRWSAAPERFEYEEGAGMIYTTEERSARQDPRYRIESDGPAPQLLFRVPARRDDPVFLRVVIAVDGARTSRS